MKGFTYLGIIVFLALALSIGAGAVYINDLREPWNEKIVEIKDSERLWSETNAYNDIESIETKTIIEEHRESEDSGYSKTEERTVLWENPEAYIEVSPHTCDSFHCEHEWTLSNKIENRIVNIGFIMPPSAVNIRFYRKEMVEKTRTEYDQIYHPEDNYTEQIPRQVSYSELDYVDRTDAFASITRNGQKIFYTTNYQIGEGKSNGGKFIYDIPPRKTEQGYGSDGKWEMYVWTGDFDSPDWSIKLDPWFDTTFLKRKAITVVNTANPTTIVPAQVPINITYDSDMVSDFSDLRFTWVNPDTSSEESVSFWTETKVASAYAEVWVKVPKVRGSNNETVYMYYKNTTLATNQSNGNMTFPLFDDFDDGSLDTQKWVSFGGCSAFSEANGFLKMTQDTGAFQDCGINSTQGYSMTLPVSWVGRGNTSMAGAGANLLFSFGQPNGASSWTSAFGFNTAQVSLFRNNTVIASGGSAVAGRLDRLDIRVNTTGANMTQNYTTLISSYVDGQNTGTKWFNIQTVAGSTTSWVDYFFVANLSQPEPSPIVGAEESFATFPVNLDSPTNNFINTTTPSSTPFRFTPFLDPENATSFFMNASLFTNQSGSFALVSSNTSVIENNTQETIFDALTDGVYLWNIRVCGSSNGQTCGFNATNFTYTVDSTFPLIDIQNPSGTFHQNTSIPINYRTFDATSGINASGCQRSIDNGANVSLSSCANTTFSIAQQGSHNMTIYVKDNGGLENRSTSNFNWFGLSNFTIVNRQNTSQLLNGLVTLSNSSYSNSTTATNGFVIYSWETLPTGSVNISVTLSGFNTNTSSKTINAFTLFNDTIVLNPAGLDMKVLDEKTLQQLTFNVTIDNSTTTSTFTNQTNMSLTVSQVPLGNIELTPVNFTGGYGLRTFFTTTGDTLRPNITAYLLKLTDSVDVTFNVRTFTETPIEGATITVKKTIGSELTIVAQSTTDSTGTSTIDLDPSVTYSITVEKSGFSSVTFNYKPASPFFVNVNMGQDVQISQSQTFQGFNFQITPTSSFIILNNGVGTIFYTTNAPLGDLSWYSINVTYNGTQVFFQNKTDASGGTINATFNLTQSLGLSVPFNLSIHTLSNGFPRTINATAKFQRADQDIYTINRIWRLTECNGGFYCVMTSVNISIFAKSFWWMVLTLLVTCGVSFYLTRGIINMVGGITAITMMVIGYSLTWLDIIGISLGVVTIIGIGIIKGRL